jgi:hypothetical protein
MNGRGVSPLGILVGFLVLLIGVVFLLGGLGLAGFPLVTLAWLQVAGALVTLIVGAVVIWLV